MANEALRLRLCATDVHDQARDQSCQVEASVEAVGECTKVAVGVLAVLEGFVGARQHRLEVAQHGVDPLELRQIPGLALADDDHRVSAPGINHRGETSKAVAEY